MRQTDIAIVDGDHAGSIRHPQAPILFDRLSGRLSGASMVERLAVLAMQAGAKATDRFHHRGLSLGCRLLRPVLGERDILVQFSEDAVFGFPFGDAYWSFVLDRGFTYEIEIDRLLRGIADVDYTFVDCGANFGLWSVLATSKPFGSHPAIAIEASAANTTRLAANARLNGDRFQVMHRAIGAASGGTAWLSGRKHEAITTIGAEAGRGEAVPIIALDSLLDDGMLTPARPLVVKLDVEGVEIDAMRGARRLFAADTAIIYEEHGSDRAHTVSRFVLNETPYRAFVLNPATDCFERLTDLATLDRIKVSRFHGYNAFAATSPFWEARLMSLGSHQRIATHRARMNNR